MSNILNITRNLWSLWVVVNHPWIWRIETCKIRFPRFFKQWASGSWTPATKSACKASPGTRKFKETGDQQNVLPCLEIPRSKVTTNNPPQRERKRTLEHFFSWQDARCIFAERKNITEIDRNHKFTFYVSNYIWPASKPLSCFKFSVQKHKPYSAESNSSPHELSEHLGRYKLSLSFFPACLGYYLGHPACAEYAESTQQSPMKMEFKSSPKSLGREHLFWW